MRLRVAEAGAPICAMQRAWSIIVHGPRHIFDVVEIGWVVVAHGLRFLLLLDLEQSRPGVEGLETAGDYARKNKLVVIIDCDGLFGQVHIDPARAVVGAIGRCRVDRHLRHLASLHPLIRSDKVPVCAGDRLRVEDLYYAERDKPAARIRCSIPWCAFDRNVLERPAEGIRRGGAELETLKTGDLLISLASADNPSAILREVINAVIGANTVFVGHIDKSVIELLPAARVAGRGNNGHRVFSDDVEIVERQTCKSGVRLEGGQRSQRLCQAHAGQIGKIDRRPQGQAVLRLRQVGSGRTDDRLPLSGSAGGVGFWAVAACIERGLSASMAAIRNGKVFENDLMATGRSRATQFLKTW